MYNEHSASHENIPAHSCGEPDDVDGHSDSEHRVPQPGPDQRVVDGEGGAIDQEPQQHAEHRAGSQKCPGPETLLLRQFSWGKTVCFTKHF